MQPTEQVLQYIMQTTRLPLATYELGHTDHTDQEYMKYLP